jgi:pyruvate dehydrogenase E1 component
VALEENKVGDKTLPFQPEHGGDPNSTSDADPTETSEWLEAFDDLLRTCGKERCEELLLKLNVHALSRGLRIDPRLNTPYCNTIGPAHQPAYPGNLEIEQRITSIIRWNAVAMVIRANHETSELGGHLASYASAADLFEVGFHHFFRADDLRESEESRADLVYFQPHSAPGIYARAFLEGRLSEEQLAHFRRELSGNGLSSYPHPRLMPEFWQFPTGSMGLGVIAAIYQARFMHYLQNRGLLRQSGRKIWAVVGDGEMDEPESVAGLTLAVRERLDNLILVVNCNLQRLDGPVRGNGSIVQELERLFTGAGWNVIKLLWGSDWDGLFARDRTGALLRCLNETVDGELQSYGANDGAYNRERFFTKNGLSALVSHLSDDQVDRLTRGGHDPVKIYAAFAAARNGSGLPTVILAQTKKGYGLGRWGESTMSAHQQKKLNAEALLSLRDRLQISLADEHAVEARFYRPPSDSIEIEYLLERRRALGGFLPARRSRMRTVVAPKRGSFAEFTLTGQDREMSTTVALVRMLSNLLKDPEVGRWIVPIVADEARTFGMQPLFRQAGIYSPCGQRYQPQDHRELWNYRESRDGQILQEGINEAGALSSWLAAATSYANHGVPSLPFYIFYSMFGFQRVGDLIWAAADARARGFLIGATAGRTTLSGEGLQHQDGTSHLMASTIPACRAYDPCYAYELATILEHGTHTLLERHEDVFYYLTVMNESYKHSGACVTRDDGILRGMYLLRPSQAVAKASVQLLGAGAILREVLAAASLLERDWNVAADVWSVTSFTELRRRALEGEHADGLQVTWIEHCLGPTKGPIIAASDYVRAVPELIRAWTPRRYVALGTDGFGRSDTRAALRRFFGVDCLSIAFAAISSLVEDGLLQSSVICDFEQLYGFKKAAGITNIQ